MRGVSAGILLCFSLLLSSGLAQNYYYSDEYLNVTQLITSKGYQCIDYNVTTEDGYVLSLQNIPGNGPPVYLQHGFLDSSATWVLNSEAESLGFILADAGYDVWLGNARGNAYCLDNIYYSSSTQEFWDFSWDQLAQYDLPAKLDFIYQMRNNQTISYIGHSEGTLTAFTCFSNDKETASKVNLFIALAPVIYCNNVGELLQITAKDVSPQLIMDIFGTMSFLNQSTIVAKTVLDLATNDPIATEIGICALAGCENLRNINQSRLPVYFSHFPSGSSTQNMLHYQQMVLNETWQMFNYGSASANEQHYNQAYPPTYSLANFNTTTALFYGSHDKMADPTDVQRIIEMMPYPPIQTTEIRGYGHADFVWGANAHQKLYPSVVDLINQQTGWSK